MYAVVVNLRGLYSQIQTSFEVYIQYIRLKHKWERELHDVTTIHCIINYICNYILYIIIYIHITNRCMITYIHTNIHTFIITYKNYI